MINYIIAQLEKNKSLFQNLLEGKTKEEYLWKVDAQKWCLLEIIGHLGDEEVLDFRTRFKTVIESPGKTPPAFDPELWVTEHKYLDQDYEHQLQKFLHERTLSIQYLKGLENPPLENFYNHASFGPLNGHFFLKNWLAHDYLHIKQITRLHYDYLGAQNAVPIAYAGKWT